MDWTPKYENCNDTATSDDLSCFLFPDASKSFREFLIKTYFFMIDFAKSVYNFEFIVCVIGIVLNIFHLSVLTRKSMMTSATNYIIISIALCDIGIMICFFRTWAQWRLASARSAHEKICSMPPTYTQVLIDFSLLRVRENFRRCSPWLALLMVIARYLTVRFSMLYVRYSKPSTGVVASLCAFLLSSLFSLILFFQYRIGMFDENSYWVAPTECTEYAKNLKLPQLAWFLKDNQIKFSLVDGIVSKLIPSFVLPIVTGLLIFELAKAKQYRSQFSNSKEHQAKVDRSANLVCFMAVVFFISEFPLSLSFIYTDLFPLEFGLYTILGYLNYVWDLVACLNGTVHCLICFAMSTQYRDTVRQMLRWKKKEGLNPSVKVFSTVQSASATRIL